MSSQAVGQLRFYRWNWLAMSRAVFLPTMLVVLPVGLLLRITAASEAVQTAYAATVGVVLVAAETLILVLAARVRIDISGEILKITNPMRTIIITKADFDYFTPVDQWLLLQPVIGAVHREGEGLVTSPIVAISLGHLERLLDAMPPSWAAKGPALP